jgi:hypothetical protein
MVFLPLSVLGKEIDKNKESFGLRKLV